MCRMMCFFSPNEISIPMDYLKSFVRASHWGKYKLQDFIGQHRMGWGVSWFDKNGAIKTQRSIDPIWRSNWKNLTKIKSRCIVLHARRCAPSATNNRDVHPIVIDNKNYMFHNGVIKKDSFPQLDNPELNEILKSTSMDTRRYLATFLDELEKNEDFVETFRRTLPKITVSPSANAFLLNSTDIYIVKYKIEKLHKKAVYQLNIKNFDKGGYCVSVIPFDKSFKGIPNKSCIKYNFRSNKIEFNKL